MTRHMTGTRERGRPIGRRPRVELRSGCPTSEVVFIGSRSLLLVAAPRASALPEFDRPKSFHVYACAG
jgi:hypothetical protein